jgi:hypothetical protein
MTRGISLAAVLFSRLGMEAKTSMLILTALLMAIRLVNRGIAILASGVLLSLVVIQPDQVLLEHGFDKDILLATLAVILLYLVMYRILYN